MNEKHYQVSPIELVQWAEPLFGVDEEPAEGFSEELVAAYEAAAGFRLPAAFRDYLLACGEASLNCILHYIHLPDKDAAPFDDNLTFSYDYIRDTLEWLEKEGETGSQEAERLRTLPAEQWNEVVGDYLLFWRENQACWYAGIRREDLDQPDPVVYYNDQDTMYHWAPFSDSVSSFLLSVIAEVLEGEADADVHSTEDPDAMKAILDEAGVDFQRLQEPYSFPGGYFAHTCIDYETNTLYVYGEERGDHPAYLSVIKPWNLDEEEE